MGVGAHELAWVIHGPPDQCCMIAVDLWAAAPRISPPRGLSRLGWGCFAAGNVLHGSGTICTCSQSLGGRGALATVMTTLLGGVF